MSYFGDMAQAVEDYPASGVLHLVFTDVQRQTGSPGAVNVNEIWKFRRVHGVLLLQGAADAEQRRGQGPGERARQRVDGVALVHPREQQQERDHAGRHLLGGSPSVRDRATTAAA